MKKRILLCNEASFLSTGFGTYGHHIMKRLYDTNKYILAEFASYGGTEANNDTKYKSLPWKYYPNLPQTQQEKEVYQPKSIDQFGAWKFGHVALDFKPDIVFDIRDWWMLEHEGRSPLRKYFKWVVMPTVDAEPQDEQWIDTYINADAVLTYSDWGLDLLKKQANGKINTVCAAPPAFDYNSYSLVSDKRKYKKEMGLSEDIYIVGTIMRNQPRKLYPDLIEAFKQFLNKAPQDIASKTYLYLHCAYPDIGWDIPKLIKEAGIASKVIFTYHCSKKSGGCGFVFPSLYQDVRGTCPGCGNNTAMMPRTQDGISSIELGRIMKFFDAYVQYALCEGFGLPQVEAAACGVPVFAVDYSAMSDVVRKIKGYPIKVQRFFREAETNCLRALPDNEDLVDKLIDLFKKSAEERQAIGIETRTAAEYHYNWDKTAKIWENVFDSIECPDHKNTWLSPANIHQPPRSMPTNLTNEQFVEWGLKNIAGREDLTNSFLALRMVRDLNWESYREGMGGLYHHSSSTINSGQNTKKMNREVMAGILMDICKERNFWEQERVNAAV